MAVVGTPSTLLAKAVPLETVVLNGVSVVLFRLTVVRAVNLDSVVVQDGAKRFSEVGNC